MLIIFAHWMFSWCSFKSFVIASVHKNHFKWVMVHDEELKQLQQIKVKQMKCLVVDQTKSPKTLEGLLLFLCEEKFESQNEQLLVCMICDFTIFQRIKNWQRSSEIIKEFWVKNNPLGFKILTQKCWNFRKKCQIISVVFSVFLMNWYLMLFMFVFCIFDRW